MEALRHDFGGEDAALQDGTLVRLRPIRPDDAARLRRMFYRLSPNTVYLRFFSPIPRPREHVLRYFSNVDGVRRLAIVGEREGEVLGVARCDVTVEKDAEVAVVVEDAWQGLGLGRALLRRLGADARDAGIDCFVATILPENRRAIGFAASAAGAQLHFVDGEVTARIPIRIW